MHHLKALALLGSSIVIMTTLSACQSTSNQSDQTKLAHGHMHGMQQHQRITEQQKQQWQVQRQHACDGKSAGDRVEFQFGQGTKTGQCQLMFKLDDNSKTLLQQTLTATERLSRQAFNQMTVEQREEIKQQRMAKRNERQALRQQLQAACQAQTVGKTVQMQYDKLSLTGQCQLRYQPDHIKTIHRG